MCSSARGGGAYEARRRTRGGCAECPKKHWGGSAECPKNWTGEAVQNVQKKTRGE